MSIQSDVSLGLKKETVYGTAVTVDRFVEFDSESMQWDPKFIQGMGMRVGRVLPDAGRRVLVSSTASGGFELEVLSSGAGILLLAGLGKVVTTKLDTDGSTDAYQHLFTPTKDDYLASYTIQKGIPLLAGLRQSLTFLGAQCSGFDLSVGNGDFLKLKPSWIAREVKTDIALAVPSYPDNVIPFSFVGGVIQRDAVPPTATALASGGVALANIRDFSMSWDNALDGGGMNLGGAGLLSRPKAIGGRSFKGKLTAEYSTNLLRDIYLEGGSLSLTLTFTAAAPGLEFDTAASMFPTLEVHVPVAALEGELPTANGGDVITQSIDWTGLGSTSLEAIYIAYRSTDATP